MNNERLSSHGPESFPQVDGLENPETDQEKVILYRGVNKRLSGEEAGSWWSTHPYYALVASSTGEGTLFVVKLSMGEIKKMAKDVSLEGDYQNYFFDEDPPGFRVAASEEIEALKSHTTFTEHTGPGGTLMKWPENAIEIGRKIFEEHDAGSNAIKEI